MSLLKLFKGKKSDSTDVSVKKDEQDEDKTKIAVGRVLDSAIHTSVEKANAKYARPEYKGNRKVYDVDGAKGAATNRAFADGKTVRDPYTGTELMKKHLDAKVKYGDRWQLGAAEADHIDPLNQVVNRNAKNPFLTVEDLREIGNADDNFQMLSKKLNQGSKEVGKGKSTQEQWADDDVRMKGLEGYIESGESIDEVRNRIRETGKAARKRNDRRAFKKGVKNAVGTAHEAGINGAKNAGVTAMTMSGIMNVVSVIKGEKSSEDAVTDTIKDGGREIVHGYVMDGSMTVVSQTLSYSSSEFLQALAQNNVPGKVVTAVIVTGDTLKKWGDGEITTQECIIQLGDKGLNMLTMGYAMAAGQALIPIPIVGGAVGALVGSMLTSNLYNSLIGDLQTNQLEHEERMKKIAECNAVAEQARIFREELEEYLDAYFQEYRTCFNDALSSIHLAYEMGDADGVIASANDITRKLGGKVNYETVEEFKSFLDNDTIDVL